MNSLRTSRTYSAVSGGNGYGYMWWVPYTSFAALQPARNPRVLADGYGGQYMLVDRTRDIVVVHRVDNSRLWFRRNLVDVGQFNVLAARILAAAPDEK